MAKQHQEFDPIQSSAAIARFRQGVIVSRGGRRVWMYRTLPTRIMAGADRKQKEMAANPITAALEEIASMSQSPLGRRQAPNNLFRRVHIFATNTAAPFSPPIANPIASELKRWYAGAGVSRRVVTVGVELHEQFFGGGSIREMLGKAATNYVNTVFNAGGVDFELYSQDGNDLSAIFARLGLLAPTSEEHKLLGSWWNWGRWADTPVLPHTDHLHFFTDGEALRVAQHHLNLDSCQDWPEVVGQHAVSFGAVHDWNNKMFDAHSDEALWAERLFSQRAMAVSIIGSLEPVKVTRHQLRKNKQQYLEDVRERFAAGKMERGEQEEALAELNYAEDMYAKGGAPSTLSDASIVVAMSGSHIDWTDLSDRVGLEIRPLDFRQAAALTETQPAPIMTASPSVDDLPTTAIAYSGINSVASVGDPDGALLGFTELDGQPSFISPKAASATDSLPVMAILGATGSGKSLVGTWLAYQWKAMGQPVIFINPKTGDHSLDDTFLAGGGRVANLDDFASADGVFDAFRFADRAKAPQLALSFLLTANPFGESIMELEMPLGAALEHGAREGARTTWEALSLGYQKGKIPKEALDKVQEAIHGFTLFSMGCGYSPEGQSLRVANTMTLINAGDINFDFPRESDPVNTWNINQRLSVGALKLLVYGSGFALSGRAGAVMFDEAWTFLRAGASELERLGRLARSMNFLPVLMTQRATDFTASGLENYISRAIVLPLGSPQEAEAACRMLKIEPTRGRLERMSMPRDPSGSNFRGMHAVIDPHTRQVHRGAVAFYRDLTDRAAEVEVRIPDWFVSMTSTNPEDIKTRERAKAAGTQTR